MTLEMRRARVSGGELAYVDEGEGLGVVLLHGFPTSSHLWRDLVPMLAPRFRAIAVDLLGYGDSHKPADPTALTITRQAAGSPSCWRSPERLGTSRSWTPSRSTPGRSRP